MSDDIVSLDICYSYKFIDSIDLLFRDGGIYLPYVGEAAPPVHYSLGEESFADIVSAAQPIEGSAQQIWQLFAVHGVLALLLQIHKFDITRS